MGTSKIVMGASVYIIIGMYALGFNTADQAVYTAARSQAFHDQARQIAQVGVRFAVGDLGSTASPVTLPSGAVSLIGGTVNYTADRPTGLSSSQVRVTSRGTYNGYQVTVVAILQYSGVKWVTQRIYQQTDAVEYARLS